MKNLTFSQSVWGFNLACEARQLSEHTISDYQNTFRKFEEFLGDDERLLSSITPETIQRFMASRNGISAKTICNYHTGLSALWTWAVKQNIVDEHIMRDVPRPRPDQQSIEPYSIGDIKALLGSIGKSRSYTRPGKSECSHELPHQERNRMIILLLLDTGLRASELCNLNIHHVDMQNKRVRVESGKNRKSRSIPISPRTAQAVWSYLAAHRAKDSQGDPLIMTSHGNRMDRNRLLKLLYAIGRRAGVQDVYIHRFRHTFAITYLRNGGDPWTLQMILGHSTMEMVRKYLEISQADLDAGHRRASPVDNWRL